MGIIMYKCLKIYNANSTSASQDDQHEFKKREKIIWPCQRMSLKPWKVLVIRPEE